MMENFQMRALYSIQISSNAESSTNRAIKLLGGDIRTRDSTTAKLICVYWWLYVGENSPFYRLNLDFRLKKDQQLS